MAGEIFLKLEGITGESVGEGHDGEIDVQSWKLLAKQTATGHTGGGAGAGKVQVEDLKFTKLLDKSSPDLLGFCCSGAHIAKGQLTVRKAGGSPLEYLKLNLEHVLISSYETGSQGDEFVRETVTLNFRRVKVEYVPQKDDGAGDASLIKGWDVAANKAWG